MKHLHLAHPPGTFRRTLQKGAMVLSLGALLAVEPSFGCATLHNTADIQGRISSMLTGSEREDAKKALGTALSHAPPDSREAIERIPQNLERGRALARELGEDANEVNALNFAYAISAVGESAARDLHNSLGIRFFLRYSRSALIEAQANMRTSDGRPLLLAAFNKNDWNSAFYREGMGLDPLLRHYRVLIVEVDSETDFYNRVRAISTEHGRISAAVIGGHGLPDSILLGAQTELGRIDTTDGTELSALRGYFVDRPTVVLISCSTGENEKAVGAVIANSWGAEVFAPVTPSSRTTFHLSSTGSIDRVSYDVETRRFVGSGG